MRNGQLFLLDGERVITIRLYLDPLMVHYPHSRSIASVA